MNQTHVHLLITHLPIIGTALGALVLIHGIWRKSMALDSLPERAIWVGRSGIPKSETQLLRRNKKLIRTMIDYKLADYLNQ